MSEFIAYFINPYTITVVVVFVACMAAMELRRKWRNRGKDEPTPKVRE